MIKTQGGVFGRNPAFNDVEVSGGLTIYGDTPSTSSTTGALIVTGGIGVGRDCYINDMLVGTTDGPQDTAVGVLALSGSQTAGNLTQNSTGLGHSAASAMGAKAVTVTITDPGTRYTDGTYNGVLASNVSGTAMAVLPTLNITVVDEEIQSAAVVTGGRGAAGSMGLLPATVLTVAPSLIGGTGSGLLLTVMSVTEASDVSAVGYQAAKDNSAAAVTALGVNALNANTGANTTAVGVETAYQNTGANTTAVGYKALRQNTGAGNTAVGYLAMSPGLCTGINNVAVGLSALDANTSGTINTAVGANALGGCTIGQQNVGVGNLAGNRITSGNNNTIIGAGADVLAATNGYCVVIGPSVGFGHGSTVLGSTSTVGTRIYGVINTGVAVPTVGFVVNTITPTSPISFLGAGLIKTITPPLGIGTAGGYITLLPTAAFTWDTSGNIVIAGTAVTGRALVMTWGGTKWYPSYT